MRGIFRFSVKLSKCSKILWKNMFFLWFSFGYTFHCENKCFWTTNSVPRGMRHRILGILLCGCMYDHFSRIEIEKIKINSAVPWWEICLLLFGTVWNDEIAIRKEFKGKTQLHFRFFLILFCFRLWLIFVWNVFEYSDYVRFISFRLSVNDNSAYAF